MEQSLSGFSAIEIFPSSERTWDRSARRRKVLTVALAIVIALALPWFVYALISGIAWLIAIESIPLAGGAIAFLLNRQGMTERAVHILAVSVIAFSSCFAVFSGTPPYGWDCKSHFFLMPVIVGANFLFIGNSERWKWPYIFACLIAFWLIEMDVITAHARFVLPTATAALANHSVVLGTLAALTALSLTFVGDICAAERDLQMSNDRLEMLLENMLPTAIAERLRSEGRTFADGFDECTILFADLVGFTRLASDRAPHEVVELLNNVFSEFDALVERHGLEKIKTIGDAYMVAAGVPHPRTDHADVIVDLALEMRDAIGKFEGLSVRIGINTGQVVAGIIGRKRFIYDLWGDAVNVASRMESHGIPGEIQISEATRQALDDHFDLQRRGDVAIKGKGPMACYTVVGRHRS